MPWSFFRSITPVLGRETAESPSAATRFAFKLFHELTQADSASNVFFSPASIMLCMTLVHELASGETRNSMANVLEIAELDHVELELQIASIKSAFSVSAEVETFLANALFLADHVQIAPALQSQLRSLYDAELTKLDFSSPASTGVINEWVDRKTKGKIRQIVNEVSKLTALVALNAVYFKGRWQTPFQKELTRDRQFRTGSGAVKELPSMSQTGTYQYYEDQHVQVAAIEYRGGLSMYIVLPNAKCDLTQFREDVTSGVWESWLDKSMATTGTIQLPRFKVEYGEELSACLKKLGMERAFDPDHAQFEQIHTDFPPVWIDQVLHRAVVEVNEEGTEAAAVTGVLTRCFGSAFEEPRKPFVMIVDHPFLVVIRDDTTKTILFMGWIGDPQ